MGFGLSGVMPSGVLSVYRDSYLIVQTPKNWLKYRAKLGFHAGLNSQGHIGTDPQYCHLLSVNILVY